MLYKRVQDITADDLESLIASYAVENERLDFKREMYDGGADDAREMVRDIIAFANRRGGLILIGVDEDDDGAATAAEGVDDAEDHEQRLRQSALANISPRLRGLDVAVIPVESGRAVIAVSIPESMTGPHMTTYRSENRFWQRHGRQKALMSIDEIEAGFMRKMEGVDRIERFLVERRQSLPGITGRWFVLQAAPIFSIDDLFDMPGDELKKLLFNPPAHPSLQGWQSNDEEPRPSLHGVRAEE